VKRRVPECDSPSLLNNRWAKTSHSVATPNHSDPFTIDFEYPDAQRRPSRPDGGQSAIVLKQTTARGITRTGTRIRLTRPISALCGDHDGGSRHIRRSCQWPGRESTMNSWIVEGAAEVTTCDRAAASTRHCHVAAAHRVQSGRNWLKHLTKINTRCLLHRTYWLPQRHLVLRCLIATGLPITPPTAPLPNTG
jgi:hypothetical protein